VTLSICEAANTVGVSATHPQISHQFIQRFICANPPVVVALFFRLDARTTSNEE
jgi:hypothetical protein